MKAKAGEGVLVADVRIGDNEPSRTWGGGGVRWGRVKPLLQILSCCSEWWLRKAEGKGTKC